MTILSMEDPTPGAPGSWRQTSGLGRGRGRFGLLALAVFLAPTGEHGRLATSLLAADLVVVLLADLAAAPAQEVLAAQALGPDRLLALLDAAGGTVMRRL